MAYREPPDGFIVAVKTHGGRAVARSARAAAGGAVVAAVLVALRGTTATFDLLIAITVVACTCAFMARRLMGATQSGLDTWLSMTAALAAGVIAGSTMVAAAAAGHSGAFVQLGAWGLILFGTAVALQVVTLEREGPDESDEA